MKNSAYGSTRKFSSEELQNDADISALQEFSSFSKRRVPK
jgi:hypothetical protein